MNKYFVQPQSGIRIDVNKWQRIEIIDVEGGQVADFFAKVTGTHDEYVSPSVTIDCNESLKIGGGSILYSNQYKPMFRVESDDGIKFKQMRIFHMWEGAEKITYGIYACSPTEGSYKATFSNMQITECKWQL